MVKMTQSFEKWLWDNHRDKFVLIALGHVELLTEEMAQQYIEWCGTEEGQKYLKGGSEYIEEEQNEE